MKDPTHYEALNVAHSIVSICDPDKHRIHRTILNPLFSKRNIARLAPFVSAKLREAGRLIEAFAARDGVVDVRQVYRRITVRGLTSKVAAT